MQSKAGPAAIVIAVVVVLIICVGLYKHFNPSLGPTSTDANGVYKPPYASGNAGPTANKTPGSKG